MDLHLLDLTGATQWTLASTILFSIIAAIATFVLLKSAPRSHKLTGFFTVVPTCIIINTVVFADLFDVFTKLVPHFGLYPIVGFLASVCLSILGLFLIAVFCGRSVLNKKGAVINATLSLVCLFIDTYLTYSAWKFARDTYKAELFRHDAGMIDIKDALPYITSDFGIEIPIVAVLFIFLIVYFISLTALKSPEEIRKDDIARRGAFTYGSKKQPIADDNDSFVRCCAYCEHADCIESSRARMQCHYKGIVPSSGVCRKYVYDPLKRKAFRPRISSLDTSDIDVDREI